MAKSNGKTNQGVWQSLAVARILIGFVFLWAFLDKLFGLGHSTVAGKSWLDGVSPTYGFLSHAAGPFGDVFHSMAGVSVFDWLFMLGLLGIGVALILGVAVRLATALGGLLLLLMWAASLPIATNPIIDDHLIYIAILAVIGYGLPNQKLSLSGWWQNHDFVKNRAWLW